MELRHFAGDEGQRRMIALANEFKAVCENRVKRGEKPWIVKIGDGQHARIEAWQYIGQRAGVTTRWVASHDVRHPKTGEYEGCSSTMEAILIATGQPITSAQCDCYADEVQKKKKGGGLFKRWLDPEGKPNRQAIKGMSQTRAASRALAAALRFLVEMAGYDGTPAEEMDGVDTGPPKPAPVQEPQATSNGDAPSWREMNARFDSQCHHCGAEIKKDDPILSGNGKSIHPKCKADFEAGEDF
jgi:hypothetical protein